MLVTFAALAWLTACQARPIPALIDVTSLSPGDVEAGERLELRGRGFPQGRPAHVRFRGGVHRAGEPARDVELEVEGVVTSGDRIEIEATEAFVEAFAGRDDDALHATFRGAVEVGFASRNPDAPPLVGTLDDVAFDVRPARSSIEATRADEGAQVLAFLGLVAEPSPRGLAIDAVAPGSLADRAGLRAGDVLAEVDGVRVLSVADVVPAGARSMRVALLHGEDAARDERTIALTGFRSSRFPTEYVAAVGLVGASLALLALFVLPPPRRLRALEAQLVAHLRRRSPRATMRHLLGGERVPLALVFASLLVGLLATAPVLGNLDGVVLFVASSLLFVVARVGGARGFVAALSPVATTLAGIAVAALSVVSMIALRGGLSLGESSRTQGFFPWQMAAMQRPTGTAFAALYLVALAFLLRPVGDDARDAIALDVDAPEPSVRRPSPGSVLLEKLALYFACALGVAMFFGGWELPGELPGAPDVTRSFGARAAASLVFVGKTWALVVALSLFASLVPPWSARAALSCALRRLLPLFVLGVLVVLVGLRVNSGASLRLAWTAGVAAVLGLLVLRSALRVHDEARRPPPHASPFL